MQLAALRKSKRKLFFKTSFTLTLLCLFCGATNSANAKSQVGQWGLGITNLGPNFVSPQLSAEWQSTKASAVEIQFGIDTVANSNSLSLGARYQRHLFLEESLIYSVYLGGGLMSSTTGEATSSSGFYFETGGLASFYLEGLPNLAFQVGSGLRLETPGGSRIRTVFFGGFHYYF
jgi:hypothetical protein